MKRILFLVLILITFSLPCAFAADMTVYENNDYHFKFSHPSDWKVNQLKIENLSIIGLSPLRKDPLNSSIPTFEVDVQKYPINIDEVFSSQSVNKLIKDFQEDPLSKKISADIIVADYFVTHLKDKKAIFIRATVLMPLLSDSKFVEERYVLFHNSNRYDISIFGTLDDLNKNRKIMEPILNSFEFVQ